ncbi:MAG TPA: ATP-binding protein [Gemmatirosa sp.]|nr:ATP-binding protein [Gemmatirosa sp.]
MAARLQEILQMTEAAGREAAVSILREAMTNVRKHAHARAVRVAMAFAGRRFRLSVRDDGRALPVPEEASGGAEHFGLLGMHERATGVGATLTVSSAPGHGTLVRLDVPFGAPRVRGAS